MSERTAARLVEVTEDHQGQRLDNFVARLLGELPRSAVYRVIRRGEVRVNGGRKSARHRLQAGDQVRLPPVARSGATADTEPKALPRASTDLLEGLAGRILHEDDDLLLLDKPSGLAVHGGSGIHLGLIESLRQARPDQFLELCHRLDRETSGVLAIAKSRRGLVAAQEAFRTRQTKKRYAVIVDGSWSHGDRSVREPLLRFNAPNGERRVKVSTAGKASRTDFRVLTTGARASRLQAALHSGRTHQIRVHAAFCGHPVVGDEKYGKPQQRQHWAAAGISQMALHAERLQLNLAGRRLDVRAPLPERFERIWRALQ
ncbi:MAG: RluA family pseudouridine synthase [Pseudomonadales bacterium]